MSLTPNFNFLDLTKPAEWEVEDPTTVTLKVQHQQRSSRHGIEHRLQLEGRSNKTGAIIRLNSLFYSINYYSRGLEGISLQRQNLKVKQKLVINFDSAIVLAGVKKWFLFIIQWSMTYISESSNALTSVIRRAILMCVGLANVVLPHCKCCNMCCLCGGEGFCSRHNQCNFLKLIAYWKSFLG